MSAYDGAVLEPEQDLGLEQIFTGSEELNSALRIKSKIELTESTIQIDDIVTSDFKKISRNKSLIGLTGVVGEWGVVSPVHVLQLEDKDDYLLLDGLRRVFGALRSGKSEIPAVVWDFSDKVEGKQLANLISLMINRSQRYTAGEMWEQMKVLEDVNDATPGLIEYLLQMHPGEAMKLKDVMLSDPEYWEIRDQLVDGLLTIEAAYKKLSNERRKENRLAKEDSLVIEGIGSDPEEISDEQHLSVDAVMDLLDLTDENVDDQSLDDLNRSDEARGGDYVQDPKDRHPLDPKLKQAVLIRDDFKCRCCGLGGEQRLATLAVHHVIEVSQGGPDSMENLVTVCVNCHICIHTYAWGKIYVKFEELDDNEKKIFKNIFKFGNIIIEADKRIGRTKEQAMKEGKGSVRHLFPGEGLAANKEAFKTAQKGSSEEA